LTLPAVTEQKRIVAILDGAFAGIDTAIANTEKKLTALAELKQSLLQKAFSGELTADAPHLVLPARSRSQPGQDQSTQ